MGLPAGERGDPPAARRSFLIEELLVSLMN
jgi:hypothetical protein